MIRSVTQTIPPTIFPRRHDCPGGSVGYWTIAARTPDFVRQEAVPAPTPGQPTARGATANYGRHGAAPLLITLFPAAPRRTPRPLKPFLPPGPGHADAFRRDTTAVDRRKLGDAARSADTGPVR